jgi:hypothetical protein
MNHNEPLAGQHTRIAKPSLIERDRCPMQDGKAAQRLLINHVIRLHNRQMTPFITGAVVKRRICFVGTLR